ncbi:MAG TPA: RnfABCDGE type electron transport complex subunit G [Bacteroidales bacterium]|nr:RnfABCDGE type electron transport complex subunit G [Bacteroidales bacterium]HOK75309.1 RnfABCDGE type electron transport complex subunit G [Bacteroidales bacterium]HOM40779.1 RnfABCDGE type electron transport complex subunit G [Bacteroidales bacterium]HOU29785.1 RnfABCDGE type electron transport complex subunit G [Bacteroidales bacterium]HPP92464.1 RnfABCDGE type electron transport complex subunit G [Bacteroidales bacterium]
MAKIESSLKNMIMSLTFIALGASAALGFVYEITKRPIELTKLNKKLEAIKAVVPSFDNNPDQEMFKLPTGEGDSLEVFPAKINNEIIGYAVRTSTQKGFSGYIGIMVGFSPDGTIINTNVLEQKETPGLGTKMTEPSFKDQFNGKNPDNFKLRVKKDGGEVDAITAATITSRAFCDALERAYNTLKKGGLI